MFRATRSLSLTQFIIIITPVRIFPPRGPCSNSSKIITPFMSIYRYRCVLFACLAACLPACIYAILNSHSHIPRATWEVVLCVDNPGRELFQTLTLCCGSGGGGHGDGDGGFNSPKTLLFQPFYTIVKNYKRKWHSGENKNNVNGPRRRLFSSFHFCTKINYFYSYF